MGPWFRVGRDLVLSLALSLALLAGCWASTGLGRVSLLFIPLWAAGYMAACLALGVSQARLFADVLGRRFRRKSA
jgi:putative peptidoglycan lipid II flippase